MTITVKKVLGDRVLIRKDPLPKRGIILTKSTEDNERLQTSKGTVIGIGPLAFKDAEMKDLQTTVGSGAVITERIGEPWCEMGDYVLYQRYSGARIPDTSSEDGYVPDLVFIQYRDLICVLNKDEENQNG